MKKHRLALFGLFAGVSALAVSSCAYDPYYSGSSYSGGYGDGYGYGGSNFSTSFFVGTGNSRWAYDPYAGCYYDHNRRAYYDPYLYGYYPVGYRPRYVSGAPHPHGWSRGSNYCPPPSRIRSQTLSNYGNRAESYRSLGRDWSRNVRVTAPTGHGSHGYGDRDPNGWRGSENRHGRESSYSRGGSFRRDGAENDRGSFGSDNSSSRRFDRGNTELPTAPNWDNRGRNTSPQPAPGFQGRPQIQSPAPSRQRNEMPSPPPQPQVQPEAPSRENSPGILRRESKHGRGFGSDGNSRGGGRGIRSLGEG